VLYVGRPALGNENSTLSLFKIDPDGKGATRVPVKVGRESVNEIQVLEGLKEGDTVILSDMSRRMVWTGYGWNRNKLSDFSCKLSATKSISGSG